MSGVQTGLQSFMDLVKFGLVIALPHPDKFGLLIILSFMVICQLSDASFYKTTICNAVCDGRWLFISQIQTQNKASGQSGERQPAEQFQLKRCFCHALLLINSKTGIPEIEKV